MKIFLLKKSSKSQISRKKTVKKIQKWSKTVKKSKKVVAKVVVEKVGRNKGRS